MDNEGVDFRAAIAVLRKTRTNTRKRLQQWRKKSKVWNAGQEPAWFRIGEATLDHMGEMIKKIEVDYRRAKMLESVAKRNEQKNTRDKMAGRNQLTMFSGK